MSPRHFLSNPQIGSFMTLPAPLRAHLFSTSTRFLADDTNLYETLGVAPNATPAEIKRQFYTLSKTHHPDVNRTDPDASDRFSRISGAYSTLANPEKRKKYDRDYMHQAPPERSGSYSSGSYAGSRPASGLSRRRATFRGPPPSFYAQGGRDGPRPQSNSQSTASGNKNSGGGFGPGGAASGLDYNVPHFDREGHFRTQSDQDQRRSQRRYRVMSTQADAEADKTAGSIFVRFLAVSAVLGVGLGIPAALGGLFAPRDEGKRKNGG